MYNANESEQSIASIHQACFKSAPPCNKQIFTLRPFTSTNEIINSPSVVCYQSMGQSWLDMTFLIQNLPPSLHIPLFDANCASHTDFLWEQNCLELFVSDKQSAYYEVNASFDGRFAVYEFDRYRDPATLPPKKSEAITFDWRNVETGSALVYQFRLLFLAKARFAVDAIARLHPCAIFYINDHPLFYAVNHANPPDFHDKTFWSNFSC